MQYVMCDVWYFIFDFLEDFVSMSQRENKHLASGEFKGFFVANQN